MLNKIKQIREEVLNYDPKTTDEVEQFRIKYLSKKGVISSLFEEFKKISPEHKREVGKELNILKNFVQEKLNTFKKFVDSESDANDFVDFTLPGDPINLGYRHPINLTRKEILDIFGRIGFTFSTVFF